MKFKSLGIIAICALSFTFMSFSSSDDLYGEAYYVSNQTTASAELEDAAWVGAAVRFTAAATRVAVRYTARITANTQMLPTTQKIGMVAFASDYEKHIKNNVRDIKHQQLLLLG